MKTSIQVCNAHPKPAFLALGTPANNKKGVSNVSYVREVRAFLKSTQLLKIYAPYALQFAKGVMANNKKGVSNVGYVR